MSVPSSRRQHLLWVLIAASTLLRLWFAWGFLGFVTGDDVEALESAGFDSLTRNGGLRDSANGCSQRLECSQLDDERV